MSTRIQREIPPIKVTHVRTGGLAGRVVVSPDAGRSPGFGFVEIALIQEAATYDAVTQPLRDAFNQLSVEEIGRLGAGDALEACSQLLAHAARARGQKALSRNLRAFEARRSAIDAAGGMITPTVLAQRLGKSRQTIKDWGDAHKILWVDDNGTRSYPLCQFDSHGQVLRGLDRFLQTLAATGITGWMALDALLGDDPGFNASPLALLQQGRVDDADVCARALSQAGAA